MNKLMMIGLIAALVGGTQIANAHCGKCDKDKKGAECAKGDACDKLVEGIALSDEQKAKFAEIKKACDGSEASCKKAKEAIRAALTAEQQKTFDANAEKCAKPAKKCCPSDKGAA